MSDSRGRFPPWPGKRAGHGGVPAGFVRFVGWFDGRGGGTAAAARRHQPSVTCACLRLRSRSASQTDRPRNTVVST